jgi:hypothetical protein
VKEKPTGEKRGNYSVGDIATFSSQDSLVPETDKH